MRPDKLVTRMALATLIFTTVAVRAEVATQVMVNVPLRDMRNDSAEEVQKRALKEADNGIVLVYAGDNAQLGDTVRLIAGECASRGFQVKSVLLANAEGGSGVTMYGQDGGPLGPKVNFDGDMKAQTAEQIERLRERLARVPSDTAARDPMDVPRCRYEPVIGSLVRKTKVCTTPRQDAIRTEASKDWTKNVQDKGANEPMKPGG